jgi:hypothetical protein
VLAGCGAVLAGFGLAWLTFVFGRAGGADTVGAGATEGGAARSATAGLAARVEVAVLGTPVP